MTPQEIITLARYELNDTAAVNPRQSDAELLAYVNEGLKEAAKINPMLFAQIGDMVCIPSQCEQAITYADASVLLDVFAIHNGRALTKFNRRTMDQYNPNWRTDTPAPAEQWAPVDGDRLKFWVYPPAPDAPATQTLDVLYVKIPAEYALNDEIGELPDTFAPAMAKYVVFRAESKDDEHVNSQRAGAAYNLFAEQCKLT